MPSYRRKLFCLALAPILLLSCIPCHASAPELSARAYALIDAQSGRLLLGKSETSELPIASTTKIMTALVAMELGRSDTVVTVRREHLREGSSMYLAEGERLTLEALLYGLLLSSGNDAAECIAGSLVEREDFIRAMNEKAGELGFTHTSFANPSGLDEEGHYSCALDMARLMAYAMQQPLFAQIVSTKTACAGTRSMQNHNKLLFSLESCVGGKTGYTGSAGRTLVTCAERDGMRLVAVTLNDGNDWQDHTALYDYGFSGYKLTSAVSRAQRLALAAVRGGEAGCVGLCAERELYIPLADGEKAELCIEAEETVSAPVKAGTVLGSVSVRLNGEELARLPLCAENDVNEAKPEKEKGLWDKLTNWLSMH